MVHSAWLWTTVLAVGIVCAASVPTQGQAQGEAAEQASDDYNPRPFLTAMVEYRRLAYSCDNVLPGSPVDDSANIDEYFWALEQNAPRGTNEAMDRIIYRLIRSQAASICTERLQATALRYSQLAAAYENRRPEGWPPAPRISAGPWCSTPSCSELR